MCSPVTPPDVFFRLALEAAPFAVVAVNDEGKIVLVSPQTEKLFGYSREELLGQSVELLVPALFRKAHRAFRKGFSKQPQPRQMGVGRDVRARRKDGSQFPVEISLSPIETPERTWVVSAIVDISARKQAEARARESEDRFAIMADSAPVMMWTSGLDKLCTFVNRRWLEFRGRAMEQEVGSGWAEGVHPKDLKRCLETYETSFGERRSFQMEYRLRRNDGEYRWVLDTGVPRFEAGGIFAGYVGSCVDVTDFKRAQEKALAQKRLESLGILAGGLAHDFNNMQSGIIALSDMILENPDLDLSVAAEVREIRKIALHGSEIVHELMIYAGEGHAVIESVDISGLIEEIGELLKLSISKRALLVTHLDKNVPPLLTNATHMRQLVMNLIVNASDAIGENPGTIDVATSLVKGQRGGQRDIPEGDYMRLVVSDTGCGMTEEIQRNIFDPFFSTKVTGRGLGLAVVQRIVQRYGGILNFKSTPGQGTQFEILLPYTRQRKPQLATIS